MNGPRAALLPGGRLHLQHGPIDLVIGARGPASEVEAAYAQATARFETVLGALVEELPLLRQPLGTTRPLPRGPVARRMVEAVWPHRAVFITPMAAVAGAVADEILAALVRGRTLAKGYVNNGGDIALHLAAGEHFRAGIVPDESVPVPAGFATIDAASPVRGIATSGWRGRSLSRGIADSATVLAANAAMADAAATMVANAVDADHPAVQRLPARDVRDDSDLGDIPVTVAVGSLPPEAIARALGAGAGEARRLRAAGLIEGAALSLAGVWRLEGGDASLLREAG